jgi:transforming growth factor-beta-induced protein
MSVAFAYTITYLFSGPFTLFAPTNDAFGAIDLSTLNTLLQDVNLLRSVLTYHVVTSALAPVSIENELVIKSLAGESLRFNVYKKGKVSQLFNIFIILLLR